MQGMFYFYFFYQLNFHRCIFELYELTVSNVLIGLIVALYDLFLESERWCAMYLYANWKKNYREKELKKHFLGCVKATNYKERMEALAAISKIADDDMFIY